MKSNEGLVNFRDLGLALLVTALSGLGLALGWVQVLERPVADLFIRISRLQPSASGPVTAVVIDDRAIGTVAPIPWPRTTIASLVNRIAEHQPRALVVDMLLTEPRDSDGDAALEEALRDLDVVLAAALNPQGDWLLPLERFGGVEAAAHSHAETDTDGVVRSIAMTKQGNDLALPSLSIAAAMHEGWRGTIEPGRRFYPDFRHAPHEIPNLSAADALQDLGDGDALLSDRIVFLGYSASGTTDQYLTPVGERNRPSPGVLVHASATSSLLRGGLLRQLPLWATLGVSFLVAWVFQMQRTRCGRLRIGNVGFILGVLILATFCALALAQLQIPIVSFCLVAVFSMGLRESIESRDTQAQTDKILTSLIREEGLPTEQSLPRGVYGRLALVKDLQDRLAHDRNLRRSLLEGMIEGVILWNESGEVMLSNPAFMELWGHEPVFSEATQALAESDSKAEESIQRGQRNLEVEILELKSGHLGLVRDVTERVELDRRRREMHRLVSHELRTPLASIAGFGEMLQSYEMSGDELHHVAGMIRGEADRLGEMVSVFLDIERLGTGRWENERTDLDLAAVTKARCEILASSATARGQNINLELSTTDAIHGVEKLISQLVDNLIGNAIKYSTEGSEINVEIGPEAADKVYLKVRDRGRGIPPEAVPHLFERFYRVPGEEAQGTGLGLALVKEVADWHGASIQVESKVGEGSCFTVVFPVSGARE